MGEHNRQYSEVFEVSVYRNMILDLVDRGFLSNRNAQKDVQKLEHRVACEGLSFLTKTLPSLGKALDASFQNSKLTTPNRFHKRNGTELPSFLGELFSIVFFDDGTLKSEPDPNAIRILREMLYCFYKYELPSDPRTTDLAIQKFITTDSEVLSIINECIEAKIKEKLSELLQAFDPFDIVPRHGPGAVAGKQTGPEKYRWTDIPTKLLTAFSPDYFVSGYAELSERLSEFIQMPDSVASARLITVPKDSRGPRVISCEPTYNMWIQQGIMKALVQHIEHHPLTKGRVNFTDQSINGRLALLSSRDRAYATLDLAEASDRVSHAFVMRAFPESIAYAFDSCRSGFTTLPSGEQLELRKFAPMGSALCFPVLALTCWASLVVNGIHDCYVYGDDIIVPTAQAEQAMKALSDVGLKVNIGKSFTKGSFRESCGCDAFNGVDVTPVRFRTVAGESSSYSHYCSWLSYANSLNSRGYLKTSRFIAKSLTALYGPIVQDTSMETHYPCLSFEVIDLPKPRRRWNPNLYRFEHKVIAGRAISKKYDMPGYHRLLRSFTESGDACADRSLNRYSRNRCSDASPAKGGGPTNAYTQRDSIKTELRWM
jgi:hypothetical protein